MNFSPDSRIWIYISKKEFSNEEVTELNLLLAVFCKDWAAHGNNLKAKGEVLYNRFIVLMVDESQAGASGCSIDTSVHFIQQIENQFNTVLFDRLLLARKNGDGVIVTPLSDLEQLVKDGTINEDTIVFNTALTTKKDFDSKFEIPFSQSWMIKKVAPLLQTVK